MKSLNPHLAAFSKKAIENAIDTIAHKVFERKYRRDTVSVPEGIPLQDWDIETAEAVREVLRQGPSIWKLPDPAWKYLGLAIEEYDTPPDTTVEPLFGSIEDEIQEYRERLSVKEAMQALA